MYQLLILVLMIKCVSGVIYTLNETEYNRMPPLFALDDYTSCITEPGAVYCLMDIDLFSTEKSDLMDMIKEYSAHKLKHYNHTQIHRGVCLSTCKAFLNDTGNITRDHKLILEECVNRTLYERYRLQGKIAEINYCNKYDDRRNIDIYDVGVAVIFLLLIVMNVIGSLYDVCCKDSKIGNPYLLAFSLRQNWKKLIAPAGVGPDPRLERLKLFHGLRTMTMVCVIFCHTVFCIALSYVENPLYIEKSYEDPLKQLLYNGTLLTHTFFVMSSFLLAYNFQIHSEKHNISWLQWPKGILLRWLRLTPMYALILATVSTWWRFLGDGPLWKLMIVSETNACRRYWWAHIFYINNYIYEDNFCLPQTWYLAADTQLFCLGLLICVMARSSRARKISLLLLLLASFVIVASHTYFQNLDAVVIQSPETYRNLYAHDDTFRLRYIRGHTNMSTYILGLAGGFLAYHWQTTGKDLTKYRNYRYALWAALPLGVAVILSGGLFYIDGLEPAVGLKVLYATFYKIIVQSLVVIFIITSIFKLESVYRGIVEWRGFTWTGRVTYSAFLLHTFFQKAFLGIQTAPTVMSEYYILIILSGYIFLTYISAAALFVLVESPINRVIKALMAPKNSNLNKNDCQDNQA
ncbi:hypothetical protein K1T71_010507 [Dendrolimus kikuchii]|uniref:Uncharacterized protein n=1 Tax=Dendrolimus kikuchii TaxID=765133 RepID=A0ACC1CRS4_9NEOP|nr:hypothetical protein K1T71_010507 [Dendrolimus kikuchii]